MEACCGFLAALLFAVIPAAPLHPRPPPLHAALAALGPMLLLLYRPPPERSTCGPGTDPRRREAMRARYVDVWYHRYVPARYVGVRYHRYVPASHVW